ncbi:MAG: hypothetical protein NTV80_02820 [Verrucomicrobia bacterium]|nr:hypothetical protein [Verrucomicrobiota bacterium]
MGFGLGDCRYSHSNSTPPESEDGGVEGGFGGGEDRGGGAIPGERGGGEGVGAVGGSGVDLRAAEQTAFAEHQVKHGHFTIRAE